MSEKKRAPLGRKAWFFGLVAVLGLALAAGLAFDAYRLLTRPSGLADSKLMTIDSGARCADVAGLLAKHEVFASERGAWYWRAYGRLSGQCSHLKSGTYRLRPNQSPVAMLNTFVAGDVASTTLTIVPGRRFVQLIAKIGRAPGLKHTLAGKSPAEIMAAIGHPEKKPEGLFLPETYRFPVGTTDRELLKRAYRKMQSFLAKAWTKRADNAAVDSPYEALILASIIEEEAAVASERDKISGVFSRRLRMGMRLQADPTVIYGVSAFDRELTAEDMNVDTPYNTYTNTGLPPTPIATPSRASIRAALNPAAGDALYFVAKGNGHHVFSKTYAEHRAAIEKYY